MADRHLPDGMADDGRVVIALGCLGRLGRWGNQVFQWSALRVAAELHGARLLCPDWAGRHVLVEAAADELLTDGTEAGLPLCADRPVLSHVGWRAWALTREPLRSLTADAAEVSGHRLRRLMQQVNADILRKSTAPGGDSYPGPRAASYWGWFAFHTSAFAPHRCRFGQLLALRSDLQGAIVARVQLLRRNFGGPPRPLWGIHMRCGEGFTRLPDNGQTTQPAFDEKPSSTHNAAPADWAPSQRAGLDAHTSSTTGVWRDTGVFWSAPAEWYSTWLEQALASCPGPAAPVVLLFSDDPDAAVRALGPHGASVTTASAAVLADAFGGGPDGDALADFFLMAQCDRLAISNSTYSFAAAMLATAADEGRCTCFRPDPSAKALVAFDPWDSLPTLKLPAMDNDGEAG